MESCPPPRLASHCERDRSRWSRLHQTLFRGKTPGEAGFASSCQKIVKLLGQRGQRIKQKTEPCSVEPLPRCPPCRRAAGEFGTDQIPARLGISFEHEQRRYRGWRFLRSRRVA